MSMESANNEDKMYYYVPHFTDAESPKKKEKVTRGESRKEWEFVRSIFLLKGSLEDIKNQKDFLMLNSFD